MNSIAQPIVSSSNTNSSPRLIERPMGDTELSYYLPSRASGVNDMYLHLGFDAAEHLVERPRVRLVWAILRVRHPLLASTVAMHSYEDVRFVYTLPSSPQDVLDDADRNLEYSSVSKHGVEYFPPMFWFLMAFLELIDAYLNGERTLSNQRLSYLVVTSGTAPLLTPPPTPRNTSPVEETFMPRTNHNILIYATHSLGDGMALHQFANEFLSLLGSDKNLQELEIQLKSNFVPEQSKLRRAICRVDYRAAQEEAIGGQTFPRKSKQPRHTVVATVSYDPEHTKSALQRCRANGVSISAALFAICNIAWAKMGKGSPDLPVLMYSAVNLRPYFQVQPSHDSYWFLAISYFTIVLPNFIPRSLDPKLMFWHRARAAKKQSTRMAKTPMFASRCLLVAEERGRRARMWAKEDDDRERGVINPPVPATPRLVRPPAPSSALIGLSLLGNLDKVYKHATFPSIKIHSATIGCRQRPGGILVFGYTIAGKLCISLGYDQNGFEDDAVDTFWENVLHAVEEYLLEPRYM
ncbi:hypothetical protein ID866_9566 [Astraeus odoratus]|nr:hypothetical protein ID866_9566 [Astraeus odoratus]